MAGPVPVALATCQRALADGEDPPPLARALYHLGEVYREIPLDLYKAVAQLLTYVYQLEHAAPGRQRPECPEFDLSNLPPDATLH